ncbi:H(+)/Cl(-) exchange transporter 4 [Smittium culicis]|uniref:H(+)/Cl(-) exchange transporter 4 n=1 Tax=Smittium culicis TaxID=133412 RepID=A0A1R1YJF7_9FUNG|nr:H(+)/Cl(-) exchange transporter 4 [Smittium culicis]
MINLNQSRDENGEFSLPLSDLNEPNIQNNNKNDSAVLNFASWFATSAIQRARYKDFSSIDFCEDWVSWSEFLGVKWSIGESTIQFFSYLLDSTVFSGIATLLVTSYAPYAAGQGIAELKTIMSGFLMKEFLSGKTLLIKCVSIVFAVASGLSVGKEVALVHISTCCANIFSNMFPSIKQNEGTSISKVIILSYTLHLFLSMRIILNLAQKRQLLSAASAAGISVAFGAPIAGVLFSLEAISYYFPSATMLKSFFCATVAAVTLKYFDPYRNGKMVPFQNVYERTWYSFELIFFVLIGVFGGIFGSAIVKLDSIFSNYRQKSLIRNFARGEVVVVAALTVIICYGNIFARSDAVTLVSNLFTECRAKDSSGICEYEFL